MSKDIVRQLKKLRTSVNAGYASKEVQQQGRESLMQAIAHQQGQVETSSFIERVSFVRFAFADFVSTPVTAFASIALLLIGGMTTVSAASNSLPGDALYGVKLATERAQLQLVSSDRRAVLHTEFAERRFKEYLALTDEGKNAQAGLALEAYKTQVEQATGELMRLQETDEMEAASVANALDQKLVGLDDALKDADASNDSNDLMEAQETIETAAESVVNVAVEIHEATPVPSSETEVSQLFKNQLIALEERKTFNIGRISVIESIALERDLLDKADIRKLENTLEKATEQVSEARRLAAAGGYRAAFGILREIDELILGAESILAETEAQIIFEDEAALAEEAEAVSETDQQDPASSPDDES